MRGVVAVILAAMALVGSSLEVRASSRSSPPPTATAVFRLQVDGHVASDATFWVAYGPFDGTFGVIQLKYRSGGLYQGSRSLPTAGRTIFSFVEGHGVLHTRVGPVPGGMVTTIRQVGPTSIWPHSVPMVRWHASIR